MVARPYYDEPEFIDEEEQFYRDYPEERPTPEPEEQSLLTPKEAELVSKALERIARARAIGKTDIKLTQPEIDALNRHEQARNAKPSTNSKALTTAKKAPKVKAIEASKKKRADSPKARKLADGRVRNSSNASVRSAKDDEEYVTFKIPDEPFQRELEFVHARRASNPMQYYQPSNYHGSPLRPGSRTASTHSLRGMPPPAYPPYYQNRYMNVPMPDGPYYRANNAPLHRRRSDSRSEQVESDYNARSRTSSNSSYRSHVPDSHSIPSQYPRPARFDPDDPRHAMLPRRMVNGPAVPSDYMPSPPPRRHSDRDQDRDRDELFLPEHNRQSMSRHDTDQADAAPYPDRKTPSDSGSDPSYQEPTVVVDVTEKLSNNSGRERYTIKTRSAAASSAVATAAKTAKSSSHSTSAKVRRR